MNDTLDTENINRKIEKKYSTPGFWNFKKQLHINQNALIITKWQNKFHKTAPDQIKKCPFCSELNVKWKHYTKCSKTPTEL